MADETIPPQPPEAGSTPPYTQGEKITKINVADEIKNSFLDYSMSVIISRALPDVRDGLKPSQRRILYAMRELGVLPNRQHRKCAKIAGDTSGNFHPHGEAVIYPTLVHMAQPWAMREPLIDGQGNFGSVDGDPPAAMRYTEARLSHLGAALMDDLDKDTVDFVPNYDGTTTEPTVFPAAFPNLLVNGGTGIAVGMATNIPPHNLAEIIDGTCALIDNPGLSVDELMLHVKGPDFPQRCLICGTQGVRDYFRTGRGSVKLRGRVVVEELKNGRSQIVVTDVPYLVNPAELEKRIAELVNEKVITDISGMRNESDENCRLVIELKRDAVPKIVINNLYRLTQLETSFSVHLLAIDGGRPKTLNLKEVLNCYIEHRREVILRRTRFELREAEKLAERLEAYLLALAHLDDFIRIIRSSSSRDEARIRLLAYEFSRETVERLGILIRSEARIVDGRYAFTEAQANAILDLRLYQLTALERDKIKGDYDELVAKIRDLLDILAREERVLGIIKDELQAIKAKHGNPRRSEIVADEGTMAIEDLIANEAVIITLTHNGLIKRTNVSAYRAQHRGGKGVIGMVTRESSAVEGDAPDFIEHLFTAGTHDYLMFFTNTGRVYVERVHEIPDMPRAARGRSIANLLALRPEEKIAALIRIPSVTGPNREDLTWRQPSFLLFATQRGTVKKTALEDFRNVRRDGIIAIGIEEGDRLIDVRLTTGSNEAVLITAQGMSIRFPESQVRPMGRPAAGVKGIELAAEDSVVALAIVDPEAMLLVVGDNGLGKRTTFDEYRSQHRGGRGIRTMRITERTGRVVGALPVREQNDVMLLTAAGQMVRIKVSDIRETGRIAMGVKLINLDPGDRLQAIAPVIAEEVEEAAEPGS